MNFASSGRRFILTIFVIIIIIIIVIIIYLFCNCQWYSILKGAEIKQNVLKKN